MADKYFDRIWEYIQREASRIINYIEINKELRIAWYGNMKEYTYWLEKYNESLNAWTAVKSEEIEDLNDILIDNIVFHKIPQINLIRKENKQINEYQKLIKKVDKRRK